MIKYRYSNFYRLIRISMCNTLIIIFKHFMFIYFDYLCIDFEGIQKLNILSIFISILDQHSINLIIITSMSSASVPSPHISVQVSFAVEVPSIQVHSVSAFHAKFYMKSSWIFKYLFGKLQKDFQIDQLEFYVKSEAFKLKSFELKLMEIEKKLTQ